MNYAVRRDALANGARFYYTGRACPRGHVGARYALGGNCVACVAAHSKSRRVEIAAWHARNPERYTAAKNAWARRNTAKVLARTREYQLIKRNAFPAWAKADRDIRWMMHETYKFAKQRENVCGGKWQVDHIVPLSHPRVCGLHLPWNLQVIPATENARKANKFEVWA